MRNTKGKTYEQIYGRKKATELCLIRQKDATKQMKKQRKGKILEQIYGEKRALLIKTKHSLSLLGEKNPNFKGGLVKIKCLFCSRTFLVIHCRVKVAKYCSDECKNKAQIKRKSLWCSQCKRIVSKKISMIGKHNFCSRNCYKEYCGSGEDLAFGGIHMANKNAHNWNKKWSFESRKKLSLTNGGTGIPYENNEYPYEFTKKLKAKIRKRDNYTCQLCDEEFHKSSFYLDCHHIDYNKNNNEEWNLICLCHKCHMKTNHNRDYWQNYFEIRMKVE